MTEGYTGMKWEPEGPILLNSIVLTYVHRQLYRFMYNIILNRTSAIRNLWDEFLIQFLIQLDHTPRYYL